MFDTSVLLASLFWGTVGVGFFIYGKKQSAMVPLIGGLALIGTSYLISSALYLSLVSIAVIVGIGWLCKRGY